MWEGLFLLRRVKIRMGSLLVLLIVPFVSAAFNLDTDSAVVYQVSQPLMSQQKEIKVK